MPWECKPDNITPGSERLLSTCCISVCKQVQGFLLFLDLNDQFRVSYAWECSDEETFLAVALCDCVMGLIWIDSY